MERKPVDIWTLPFDGSREHMRASLRGIIARYTDAAEFTFGPHGKPALAGVEFNLSHAGEFALVAVTAATPVGVDIELIRPKVDIAKLLARIGEQDLPETREELFARWTRREALSKAVGGALMMPPPEGVYAVPITAPAGYVASVALVGALPEPVYRENA